MIKIIQIELYKLKKSKLFWGIIAYILLMFPLSFSIADEELEMQCWGIEQFYGLVNSKAIFIFPFFVSVFYSSVILIDNNACYFRDLLSSGYKRRDILFGKVIPTACISSLFSLMFELSMIVPLIIKICSSDFKLEMIPKTVLFILIMLIYYFTVAFITDCVVMLIPSPVFIIVLALFENLIIQMPPALGADVSSLNWTIFYLALDFNILNTNMINIIKILIGCLVYFISAGWISYVIFKKREFK